LPNSAERQADARIGLPLGAVGSLGKISDFSFPKFDIGEK